MGFAGTAQDAGTDMTQAQISEAWKLRAKGLSWTKTGIAMGLKPIDVRNALYPQRANGVIRSRHKHEKRIRRLKPSKKLFQQTNGPRNRLEEMRHHTFLTGSPKPPTDLLIERDARVLAEAERNYRSAMRGDLSYLLGGLPPPGRSALDKRGA